MRSLPRMDQLLVFETSSSMGVVISVVMMPFRAPVSLRRRVIALVSTSAIPALKATIDQASFKEQ